MKDLLTNLEL